MLKFNQSGKINLKNKFLIENLYEWLPHSNEIIVVKEVCEASSLWGFAEIDIEKIKSLEFFQNSETIPAEYAIEILAQSIGIIGIAQSKAKLAKLAKREKSKKAYVTGLKNFTFHTNSITLDQALYTQIFEARGIDFFKFCNVKLYQKSNQNEKHEKILVEGVIKVFFN